MSTAVLYSGQARTVSQCLPTQHWQVFRHFPDLHFFVVWQKSPEAEAGVKLLEARYGADRVHAELIDDPTDLPMIPLHYGAHAPYANAAPHPQLMMQHWYQERVWNWTRRNILQEPEVYIRMRADNYFHSFTTPDETFFDIRDCPARVVLPRFARFGGVNDRFAIMGSFAAKAYFTVYSRIDELLALGCPFHPESLLKAALELGGVIQSDDLQTVFSTWRADGKHRDPEYLPVDLCYFADR